jgi:hypothetical protein
MTLTDIKAKELLRASDLAKFGSKVIIFTPENPNDEYHFGSLRKAGAKIVQIPALPNEKWGDHITRIQYAVHEELQKYPSEFYTGIHKESDWSKSFFWDKGWHLVNRTGDYAVVRDDCTQCVYHKNCFMRGDLVHWCKTFAVTGNEVVALAVAEK